MKKYFLFALTITSLWSCKNETKEAPTTEKIEVSIPKIEDTKLSEAEAIAFKSGLENWKDVSQIEFTFNVDRGGKNVARRAWTWKPKTGDITMKQGDRIVNYNRTSIDSTAQRTDQGFINDKFWLLAPYQLVWDEGTKIIVQDTATAPISGKLAKKLTIVYGTEGGYTPGDAYDYYYDEDFIIDEWVFRKSNQEAPTMMTTFDEYQLFEGLNISTVHSDKEGNLKLYFTDIKVTR